MMQQSEIFAAVLQSEGAFSNHPADNQGATAWGVTLTEWRKFTKRRVSLEEFKKITPEQAKLVYEEFYWRPLKCDELPSAVAYVVFDAGLLHGIVNAARYLQLAVGAKVDGMVGPLTVAATISASDAETVSLISSYRMRRIKNHMDYLVFGKGWTNRIIRVKAKALQHVRT